MWPWKLLGLCTRPVDPGTWLLNLIVQRVFRVNGNAPFMVHWTSRVSGDVTIGRGVGVSLAVSGGCYIQGHNGVTIGDDTIIAPGVKVISGNHDLNDFDKSVKSPPVIIGQRCWIGANAVVLPGVSLGDDVVVGAGAVVTKSCEPNVIVAGVPATVIRRRS